MDTEIWKDIEGYEGRYQISNLGRVKSLARFRRGKNNSLVPVQEKIMTLNIKKPNGRTMPYAEVRFRDGGTRSTPCKSFLVHRLVAAAFIRPLNAEEQVDHINGVHADNRVENLRILHYTEHGRIHPILMDAQKKVALQNSAQAAIKTIRVSGWKSGGYTRTEAHKALSAQVAKNNLSLLDRDEKGRFKQASYSQGRFT